MKIRHLLAAAAMALPLAMGASVPAYTGIQTLTNPDGSTVQLRLHGNHRFSYWTDAEENYVMERDADGKWVRAYRNGRYMTTDKADINLLRSECIPMNHAPSMMAALDSQGRTTYPTLGESHALVVLVQFDDVKFTVPDIKNSIDKMLNEEGYSDYDAKGSARDYFKACSDGKFSPIFDVTDVVTLSEGVSYYGAPGTYGNGYSYNDYFWSKGLKEALLKVKEEQNVDFSKYDYDNDGKIDNVFFFYAGYGEADGKSKDPDHELIWPHQGDYSGLGVLYPEWTPVELDGKKFATYACGNELPGSLPPGASYPYLTGIGTFCHEYGHVLGLPDLYDTGSEGISTTTPGKYDIMDHGSYNGGYQNMMMTQPPLYSAYERWVCNWLDSEMLPGMIEDNNGERVPGVDVSLSTNSKGDGTANMAYARMKRPFGNAYWTEYYFFETRTPEGWDETLPQHGLYIWHIRYDRGKWNANAVNTDGEPYVELIPYDSRMGLMTWGLEDQVNYVYPLSTNAIKPASTVPDGFGLYLTNINYDEEKGMSTFEYNKYVEQPEVTALQYTPFREEKGRKVWLWWEEVPGATDYMVTVYRIDGNGTKKYMNSLNETSVGNVTQFCLENLSTNAFELELHAYVRPVVGIPSKTISNERVFIPSQLEVRDPGAGVDGIDGEENEFHAYGLDGRISASEGSEAYNMNGQRVGMENLPAGVYIVRNNGRSIKVMVK